MADVHVIGAIEIYIGGLGIKYARTTPFAVVGTVAVSLDPTGVQGTGPPFLTAVVGTVGLQVNPTGAVGGRPSPVAGTVKVVVGGKGVFGKGVAPIHQIGSVGVQVGPAGVIALNYGYPLSPPVLAVVGSVGLAIGGTGVADTTKPPVQAVVGTVGVMIGQFRVPELTVYHSILPADLTTAVIGSVGVEPGGAQVPVLEVIRPSILGVAATPAVADAMIQIGLASIIAILYPQVVPMIGDTEVAIGGAPGPAGVFETYVLTGTRGEPSLYSGFSFNSYALYRKQYFGAGQNGIYLLEGDDDAGDEIHPGVRIGPINFGTDREKRMRLLRCGGDTTGAQVKVSSNGQADYADVDRGRAAVSRKVQGRELTIEISDFATLDHLEIVPLVLAKR